MSFLPSVYSYQPIQKLGLLENKAAILQPNFVIVWKIMLPILSFQWEGPSASLGHHQHRAEIMTSCLNENGLCGPSYMIQRGVHTSLGNHTITSLRSKCRKGLFSFVPNSTSSLHGHSYSMTYPRTAFFAKSSGWLFTLLLVWSKQSSCWFQ